MNCHQKPPTVFKSLLLPSTPSLLLSSNPHTPLPKATYSFDFDKLDDPNFNPFGASVKMDNPCGVKSSPAAKVSAVTEQLPAPAAAFPQLVTRAPSPWYASLFFISVLICIFENGGTFAQVGKTERLIRLCLLSLALQVSPPTRKTVMFM